MRSMWMFVFMILPLLAVVYIGWHVWAILPFPREQQEPMLLKVSVTPDGAPLCSLLQ